jgi:hypothetical protein
LLPAVARRDWIDAGITARIATMDAKDTGIFRCRDFVEARSPLPALPLLGNLDGCL